MLCCGVVVCVGMCSMQCVVWCLLALLIVVIQPCKYHGEDEHLGMRTLVGGRADGIRKKKQLGRDRGGMRGRSDEIEEGGERWMEIAGRSDKGSRRDWPQLQEQR